MKKASLITDGSCLGNPGPGGWACILRYGAVKKELFGYDPHTTNNRMELRAPIQGPYEPLHLNLGRNYLPPKPQAELFDAFGGSDEEDGGDEDMGDPG